ncbi:AtaL-like protein [Azonexus sp.]|jgi:hypothetical protein|uniref:AtaL-like protein n=1 Tax=Azonexus sp. TaxID=1872668 RepID=UPI00283A92D7|nr:AtaL-like protein [Azonexus sp.]
MQFEHLIAINDPGNPLLTPLSRQQVWAGLLQRLENLLPFLPGLEHHADYLVRELNFGAARLRDRVAKAEGQ